MYTNVQHLVVWGTTDLTTNTSAFVDLLYVADAGFEEESSRLLSPANSPNCNLERGAVIAGQLEQLYPCSQNLRSQEFTFIFEEFVKFLTPILAHQLTNDRVE